MQLRFGKRVAVMPQLDVPEKVAADNAGIHHNSKHSSLERLANNAVSAAGRAVSAISKAADSATRVRIWPVKSGTTLEKYILHENRNPYIAALLGSVYRHNLASESMHTMSIDEALTKIRGQKQAGAVELLNHVNAVNIAGGGGLRGDFYTGQYRVFADSGILFWYNFGISIGAISAAMNALRRQSFVYGSQKAYGIDIFPSWI